LGRLERRGISEVDCHGAQQHLGSGIHPGFDDVLEIRPLTGTSDIPPNLLELIKTAAPTWSASLWK
jgi:hypothetical protein